MAVRVVIRDRDLLGRFTKKMDPRRKKAQLFLRQFANGIFAPQWAAQAGSVRVATAIRVVAISGTQLRIEARTSDVGFPAIFVEEDTAPHRIEPTQAHGLLVFPGTGGGTVFVRGGVNHPGTKGKHGLRNTISNTRPDYLKGLRDIWVDGK